MTPSHCDIPPLAFLGGSPFSSVSGGSASASLATHPTSHSLYKLTTINLHHTSTMAPPKSPKKGKLARSASTAAAAMKKAKRTATAVAPRRRFCR
jgi:hypothetical protein